MAVKKHYKVILNVEVPDPESPFPAGGDYNHMTLLEGVIHGLCTSNSYLVHKGVRVTLDKVIERSQKEESKGKGADA